MIQCDSICKTYHAAGGKVCGLEEFTLQIQKGEFLVIRGHSGSGKTTLLMTLGGMLRPTRGRVLFEGRDLYAVPAPERARFRAASIGFVFQMFHLVPYLTVEENVILPADGTISNGSQKRATEVLEQLGLSHRAKHRPGQLSAGERQRTAIARALFNRPSVVLADEPTGNLDPQNAGEVFRHLEQFHQSGGTVVVVTHGEMANQFAHRVIHLENGRIRPDSTTP